MNRTVLITVLVLLVILLGTGGLFWVQNAQRTTQLSLDLWFVAWQLQKPVPIPVLLAVSTGGGFVLGAVPFWLSSMRQARRARRAEQELALAGATGSSGAESWRR